MREEKNPETHLFKQSFKLVSVSAEAFHIVLDVLHVLLKVQQGSFQLISLLYNTKQFCLCNTSLKNLKITSVLALFPPGKGQMCCSSITLVTLDLGLLPRLGLRLGLKSKPPAPLTLL